MSEESIGRSHGRRGAVKRARAEHYLLLSLVAFAAAVIVTRLYLQMTGYPQIGGGNIHIAHLLWGGLLLYIAALLPLIFGSSRALTWSAVLSGVGIGLFIDEVGKFITSNNDYFYPPAAPIIYAVFLLSILLFVTVRRRGGNSPRADLYHALEALPDLIDGKLTEDEIAQVEGWLRVTADANDSQISALGTALSAYVENVGEQITAAQPGPLTRLTQWIGQIGRRLGRRWHRRLVLILGGWHGLQAIGALISLLMLIARDEFARQLPQLLISVGQLCSVNDMRWFSSNVILVIAVGTVALVGVVLMLRGRELSGVNAIAFSLLLSLTTVVLLTFYLSQFAAIASAVWHFLSLLIVISYRRWYLPGNASMPDGPG